MIRPLRPEDTPAVRELVRASGMFSAEDVEEIITRIEAHFHNPDVSLWSVYEEENLEGVVYCIPEPMSRGTWNVLMLLVDEKSKGNGFGKALMKQVQTSLAARKARLLIVETSGTAGFEGAQRFYAACGFKEVARIPDFYDAGDDKIIFTKAL